jgi:glucosylceramidase
LNNLASFNYIDGVAFHCYAGDVSAQSRVKAMYPTKDIYFTECSGTFSLGDFQTNLLWNVNNLVIGATRNWAKTVLLWNLALDEKGNPNVGGCRNCRGVVTINSKDGSITKNEEYYTLAHFGRVSVRGAYRVNSTESFGNLRSVAYLNPDQSRAMIVTNDGPNASPFSVQEGSRIFYYTIPKFSVVSFYWVQPKSTAQE